MAAPFVGLGLKAANALIDKHFEKIPDKYMRSNAYTPKNLPNPLKKKKRKDAQNQAQDSDESRPASPSPQYVDEDGDNVPIHPDIPRHSGASLDDFISPPGQMPQQYSTAPPKIRPEYIPPPPIGMVYPSPPPPQPDGQFPPQPMYNQFPPPPRNEYYPPSPPSTADPSWNRRRHRDGEQRHREKDRRRDRSSDEDRRGRRPKNSRRSSSYEPPYEKQVTRHSRHENGEESQTEEYYRSARRPKNLSRRSSSHQPSRNQELLHYTTNDEDRSNVSSRRPKTSAGSQALNSYDDQYDISRSRASRRPRMVTRRSSSYHGRDSDSYYPPSTRDNGRRRRDSVSSPSKRYSGFDDSRPQTSDPKEDPQFFTKSKEGILSGALGAVVGGWAAQRVQRSGSGRDGRRGSGSGRGRGQEDDKVLTLLGAAVGGLAANAVVERMEESKVKKERADNGKRDSRVYEWDDGYA